MRIGCTRFMICCEKLVWCLLITISIADKQSDNMYSRDAPITHWPIIGRPIIGAKQSADYRLIQKVTETGQKPAVHTV